MPIAPLVASSLLAAGGQAASSIGSIFTRKKDRQHDKDMFNLQKNSNIELWNMQNAYNSPFQQKQRLQEAGLNPALMYGSSASGAAGNASPIDTPDVVSAATRPVDWGSLGGAVTNSINQIADVRIKQAQARKIGEETKVLQEEKATRELQRSLLELNVVGKGTENKSGLFKLSQDYKLGDTSVDFKKQQLEQLKQNMDMKKESHTWGRQKNVRENLKTGAILKELSLKVLREKKADEYSGLEKRKLEASIKAIENSNDLKKMQAEMWKNGIDPDSPALERELQKFIQENVDFEGIGDGIKGTWQKAKDTWKSWTQ